MQIFTFILAIKRTFLSEQTYILGDFNILVHYGLFKYQL